MLMRTNIVLDDELMEEAKRLTGARTKREVVHLALKALVEERRRKSLLELAGKARFRKGYDPAETRAR
jgi:Arc/MetJ family transcription regulator